VRQLQFADLLAGAMGEFCASRRDPSIRSSCVGHGWNRLTCQPRLWPHNAREWPENGFIRCRAACELRRRRGLFR
jgi:hypothetical protein